MAEPEFQTQAEAYVAMALWGIKLSRSASGLRAWWAEQAYRHEEYGLSQEQTDTLIQACKDHIKTLDENAEEAGPAKTERRKPNPRQLPLI
jgi:hypothetical protein